MKAPFNGTFDANAIHPPGVNAWATEKLFKLVHYPHGYSRLQRSTVLSSSPFKL